MRFRYAPTPSGFLHIGNGVNLVYTFAAAKLTKDSKILLRIDDLDAARKRPEYVQDIFDTLDWLQLEWHEGPTDTEDFEAHWSQQYRLQSYQNLLDQLRATGLLFACNQSRKSLTEYGEHYPDHLREQNFSLDAPDVAWRIITPEGIQPKDFVVCRRDGIAAYQVASLADDLTFGITHWVRGEDLRDTTAAQLFLAKTLNLNTFERVKYWHHPLLRDDSGAKLSKTDGAIALAQWRKNGIAAQKVYEIAAQTIGCTAYAGITLPDLVDFLGTRWASIWE